MFTTPYPALRAVVGAGSLHIVRVRESPASPTTSENLMTVKPWTFVGSRAAAATLSLATSGFGQCGTGGDCCAANPGPFCSDVTCCEQVCAADPFCCDTQWDQVCADTAAGVCTVCGATTCPVDCSSANAQEDEFCGDDTNGGCNSGGTLFTPAALGDIICGNYWADANTRDTDWYEFTLAENTVVNVSLVGSASIGSALGLLDANCPPGVLAFATSTPGDCTPLEINGTCLVAGTYRIFVGAANFNGVPCDLQASYLLSIIDTGETCTGPENDECAGALPIGIGDTSFDTSGSISNTNIPDCNFFGSTTWNKDLWYSFTPDVDGLYRLTTCGQADFDTKIAVFDGCGGNVVGCNDDGAGCPGFTSDLLVPMTAGTAYKITIGGFGTASGTGVLTIAQIEACDTTCDKAAHQEQEICGEDTNGGCNGGIGNEYIGLNRTVCGTFWAEGGTRDTDWFEFDLLEPAVVTMTAQSTLNVTIGLLTNTCPPTIYEIDATQSCGATISACLPAGSSVAFIARAGFDDPACGSGDLNSYTFTLSVGETCEPPACGVKSAGSCCEPHENPYCSDATCCELICSADPFCCNTEWDQICADQAAGQCEACGATPPPNDDCSGAIAVTTGLTPFDTAGAGSDTDAGAGCVFFGSSLINNDVWFKYTATQNADITVATCGLTTLDTKMAIFLNCGDTDAIACNDDNCGLQSSVTFPGTSGTTYYISLGAFGATQFGSGQLSVNVGGGGGPTNDDCSGSIVANVGSNNFSTVGCTTDTNAGSTCVFFGNSNNYNDAWYKYTAVGNETVTIATCQGTTMDTKMAVFSDCDLTTVLACNDDATGCGLQSRVTFTPICGTTYYISIGAYGSTTTGAGTFTIQQNGACGNPADLNGDGVVNAADLATLLGAWGTSGPGDLNGDGIVGSADLTALLAAWSA